jgi:hypothetical protein
MQFRSLVAIAAIAIVAAGILNAQEPASAAFDISRAALAPIVVQLHSLSVS